LASFGFGDHAAIQGGAGLCTRWVALEHYILYLVFAIRCISQYFACQDIFIRAVSIGENKFLRFSSRIIFLQLEVDAIFPSTIVVRLVLVPGDVVVENPGALTAAPRPTSSAVPLGSSGPVVEISSPGTILGNVCQTFEFSDALNEQRFHPQFATSLPVLLPGHLSIFN
jgi:hypothetical protein